MTPKQERFVAEYLKDSNGTQAAIRAGYSETSAAESASENLRKSNVALALARKQATIAEKAGLSLESHLERLNELAQIAIEKEQISAAVTAETNRGKAAGLYVTRIVDETPADKDALASMIFAALNGQELS